MNTTFLGESQEMLTLKHKVTFVVGLSKILFYFTSLKQFGRPQKTVKFRYELDIHNQLCFALLETSMK